MTPAIRSKNRYEEETFEGVELRDTVLKASEFFDCTFEHVVLAGATLLDCRLASCTFRESDLSLLKVPGTAFSGVRFESSKVIGVDWTPANWASPKLGKPIGFSKCAIGHSTFLGLGLKEIEFRDCDARDVDFREADLSEADFGGTDLTESLFSDTRLSGADLRSAKNYTIDPARNVLAKTRFSLPEAMALLHAMDIVIE